MKKMMIMLMIVALAAISGCATYKSFDGVAEDSLQYEQYKMCVDSCGSCEQSCGDSLLLRTAQTTKDTARCDDIVDESLQQECKNSAAYTRALVEGDAALCNTIQDDARKEYCSISIISKKAVEAKDEEQCNALPEAFAASCKNSIALAKAVESKDCSKLPDLQKQLCTARLQEVLS